MLLKLKSMSEFLILTLILMVLSVVGLMWLRILEPMWPLFTAIFFITMTICGIGRGNWVISFGGLILYLISWPVTSEYGTVVGMAVCTIGLIIWMMAPFMKSQRPNWGT